MLLLLLRLLPPAPACCCCLVAKRRREEGGPPPPDPTLLGHYTATLGCVLTPWIGTLEGLRQLTDLSMPYVLWTRGAWWSGRSFLSSVPLMYLHRWLRIVPTFAFIVAVSRGSVPGHLPHPLPSCMARPTTTIPLVIHNISNK